MKSFKPATKLLNDRLKNKPSERFEVYNYSVIKEYDSRKFREVYF